MDDFLEKLNNLLDEVDDNIKSIKEITGKNHRLLEIIFGRDSSIRDIVKEHNELDFIESSVGSDQWRLYQHRSVVTQLYAIYEDFVEKLISIWIDNLPNIFDKYSDLGIDFQKQYILGIAQIIEKLNRKQYKDLDIEKLVQIPDHTKIDYKLIEQVFTHHENNLRLNELNRLLTNCGVQKSLEWISKSEEIKSSKSISSNDENNFKDEIEKFIDYRNAASHNIIQISILNYNQLINLCNFINIFCQSLHDLFIYRTLQRMIEAGKVISLGKIKQYRDILRSSRLKVNNVSLSVGATVFLVNENTSVCKQAKIISIADSQDIKRNSINVDVEQDIFLKFDIEAKKNWLVYLLKT